MGGQFARSCLQQQKASGSAAAGRTGRALRDLYAGPPGSMSARGPPMPGEHRPMMTSRQYGTGCPSMLSPGYEPQGMYNALLLDDTSPPSTVDLDKVRKH